MSYPKYEAVLRHCARPEKDRSDAARVLLSDAEALFVRPLLVEHAAYDAKNADEEAIALGYAEYIDKVVRDEGKNHVYLYAHTQTAMETLRDAVAHTSQTDYMSVQTEVRDRIIDNLGVPYDE